MPKFRLIKLLLIIMLLVRPASLLAADQVRVAVHGLEEDALENVLAALSIPTGLVREGKVDALWLKLFRNQVPDKVRNALQPFGYYNAQVDTALENPAAENYLLVVTVVPGKPVRVTAVDVGITGKAAGEESLKELVADFPLRKGDVLLQAPYEKAKAALKSKALELGYLDADFSAHEILISGDKTTARITLTLNSGPRYLFGEATITGAPEYPDRFLRRYLTFRRGDIFSYAKVNETQLNFINADRFREVVVTPDKDHARDLQVPVLVQLKPSQPKRLRVGGGYGTDTGARFIGRYKDVNMFSLGHELQTELYIAQRLQGLGLGYIIPGSGGVNSSTGLQVNLQHEDVSTYTSKLVSAEVDRNRGFGGGRVGTVYLQLLQEWFTVAGQNSSSRLVLPGLRFTERYYDDPVRPTEGHRYTLEVRGTHQFLGSDTGLVQLIADGNAIFPLPWRLSLSIRGKVGMTAQNDPLSDIPPSVRFFAGGDTSVRGYSYQSLGPRDSTGQVVGGRDLIVGSVELQKALFESWGVSAFFDSGNAFNSFSKIRLYSGTGVGLHYFTRVGSINLYLARQIGVPSPGYHIHFTMGFEF